MTISMMELAANACANLQTEEAKLAWLDGYAHGIRQTNAKWDSALAAATGTARTQQAVECEASHSGAKRNAHPSSDNPEKGEGM